MLAVDLYGVVRRLRSPVPGVVAHHLGDAQPVIGKNAGAAFRLRLAVLLQVAPAAHRLLVAPERERDEFRRVVQALEALDGKKAVEAGELLAELGGDREVLVLAPRRGGELENHCDHARSSSLHYS